MKTPRCREVLTFGKFLYAFYLSLMASTPIQVFGNSVEKESLIYANHPVYWQPGANRKLAPKKLIEGKVVDENGNPLIGATILIQGTNQGTITDTSGHFSLEVEDPDLSLKISFIGYADKEIQLLAILQKMLTIQLEPAITALQDVVVTALGIQRNERTLGYSVESVSSEEVSRVPQTNILNALSGKVPGVAIYNTSGVGSSVSMVIRGASSLSGDNQPLFVVDGIPLNNQLNNINRIGRENWVDYGNAISDLNPEDIQEITVLKGPSAAALYGTRAGNGVVLITTKNGSEVSDMKISLTSSTVFQFPYKFLPMQKHFASGVRPYTPENNPYDGGVLQIEEGSFIGVGPALDQGYEAVQWNSPVDDQGQYLPTPLRSYADNVQQFVQTGITTTNGLSIANRYQQLNYRLGVNNLTNKGIIPNSDFHRNNLSMHSDFFPHRSLTISTSINLNKTWANNRPSGNRGTNPLEAVYRVSPHINIADLKQYWQAGEEGIQQRSQAVPQYDNPYFLAYAVTNSFVRNRAFANVKADWQISPEFKVTGRYSFDQYNEERQTKIPTSYSNDINGVYGIMEISRLERNTDLMVSYQKVSTDLILNASLGGNVRYNYYSELENSTRDGGSGLIIPNVYTLSNIQSADLSYANYWSQKGIKSVYGLVNLSYQDKLFLDLTARNDWSSTLPSNNRSYFYPSISTSALLDHILDLNNQFSLLKVRAGWAQVGNDTEPYALQPTLYDAGEWNGLTRVALSNDLLTANLRPEIATSWETGLDIGLWDNRVRFQGTYYLTQNQNQIVGVSIPSSTGYTSQNLNVGLVSSRGIELTFGYSPISKENFSLDMNMNFTRNRTRIESLSQGLDLFRLWSDSRGGAWTYVGEDIGDLYDRKLVVVEDSESPYYGYPILDANGSWQSISQDQARNKVGNFNPDFILGFQTSLHYKNFGFNMTLDWRQGGQFFSQTFRYFESDMRTQRWLDLLINPGNRTGAELRDWLVAHADELITDGINIVGGPGDAYGGFPVSNGVTLNDGVFNPGVIAQYDAEGNLTGYQENLGGEGTKYISYSDNYPWDFFSPAMFDASFIKLREISFSYTLPSSQRKRWGLQEAVVSIYSQNIMLWTKAKIGIDPENAFQPEDNGFKQGIERFNINPWVFPIGFKFNASF